MMCATKKLIKFQMNVSIEADSFRKYNQNYWTAKTTIVNRIVQFMHTIHTTLTWKFE